HAVHAAGQTVRAAVEGRGRSAMKVLAVTVLTSFDNADLLEMGIVESVHDTVIRRARLAISLGADGVVASGVEAAMIRRELGKDPIVVIPGIRPVGASHDDQATSRRRPMPLPPAETPSSSGGPLAMPSTPRRPPGPFRPK